MLSTTKRSVKSKKSSETTSSEIILDEPENIVSDTDIVSTKDIIRSNLGGLLSEAGMDDKSMLGVVGDSSSLALYTIKELLTIISTATTLEDLKKGVIDSTSLNTLMTEFDSEGSTVALKGANVILSDANDLSNKVVAAITSGVVTDD